MSTPRKDSPCGLESTKNKLDIDSVEQLLKTHVEGTEWGTSSAYDFRSTFFPSQYPSSSLALILD
jgi:hypothetical protein